MDNIDKYIIGTSDTKKTRKMLEEAKKSGAIVVCKHPLSMQSKANAYGIYGLEFICYEDVELEDYSIDGKKVAIDEIGDFFAFCFGAELDSFTMTID